MAHVKNESITESSKEQPLNGTALQRVVQVSQSKMDVKEGKSAVSGDSCSLIPPVVGTVSERSVHWKPNIKEDEYEKGESEGTPPNSSSQSGSSVAHSVQRLEEGCAQLQRQLTDEVKRTTVSHLRAEQDDQAQARGQDVIRALRLENARLRAELDTLTRLNKTESAAERLQEIQAEIKSQQDKVGRLQDEVDERRSTHSRELQRRQAELRHLVQQCEASRTAVRELRADNRALRQREHVQEAVDKWGSRPLDTIDLQAKLDKANARVHRAERELEEKRLHPKKIPHSVASLEVLRDFWKEHAALLEGLRRREARRCQLHDRVDMFARNIGILRAENEELGGKLSAAHEQLGAFVERPAAPTALVARNVSLLRQMEEIEAALAEKAVELDHQEGELRLEQDKVRELLVELEGLRRENRHLNRRLQKATGPIRLGGSVHEAPDRRLGSTNLSMFLMPVASREGTTRQGDEPLDTESQSTLFSAAASGLQAPPGPSDGRPSEHVQQDNESRGSLFSAATSSLRAPPEPGRGRLSNVSSGTGQETAHFGTPAQQEGIAQRLLKQQSPHHAGSGCSDRNGKVHLSGAEVSLGGVSHRSARSDHDEVRGGQRSPRASIQRVRHSGEEQGELRDDHQRPLSASSLVVHWTDGSEPESSRPERLPESDAHQDLDDALSHLSEESRRRWPIPPAPQSSPIDAAEILSAPTSRPGTQLTDQLAEQASTPAASSDQPIEEGPGPAV